MLIWIAGGIGVLMGAFFIKTGKPVLSGGITFWLLNLLSGFTGVQLSLNLASAFSAVLLGAPGICSLWLLRFLWK